jgi:hypothetical protein
MPGRGPSGSSGSPTTDAIWIGGGRHGRRPRALEHRLVEDRIYADPRAARARELGFPVLVNDGTRPLVDEADLSAARRWENEMAAANIRAWLSSPEAPGFEPQLPFACECGARGCDAVLRLTLAEYEAGSVRSAH